MPHSLLCVVCFACQEMGVAVLGQAAAVAVVVVVAVAVASETRFVFTSSK